MLKDWDGYEGCRGDLVNVLDGARRKKDRRGIVDVVKDDKWWGKQPETKKSKIKHCKVPTELIKSWIEEPILSDWALMELQCDTKPFQNWWDLLTAMQSTSLLLNKYNYFSSGNQQYLTRIFKSNLIISWSQLEWISGGSSSWSIWRCFIGMRRNSKIQPKWVGFLTIDKSCCAKTS